MILFDSDVFTVNECRNKAFYRKIHESALTAIAGANPYVLYGFQTDEPTLVGSYNEGTSGVLGNMAWTNIGLRTGNGWYVPPQIPGAQGFGMVNDGGASGFVGTVVNHSGINIDGLNAFTAIFIINPNGDGEGNLGRVYDKGGVNISYLTGDTGTACNLSWVLNDSAGAKTTTTIGTPVRNNFWNVVHLIYDGTQALGSRMIILVNGLPVGQTVETMGATAVDNVAQLVVMDNAIVGIRAFDGELGLLALMPGSSLSQAQAQAQIELRGLFQPNVLQQPGIITPGHYGYPEYNFDGVADPNSDHLATFQAMPLKTQQGTVLSWFSPNDLTTNSAIWALSTQGVVDDEFVGIVRGDLAGDPLNVYHVLNGGVVSTLQTPGNLLDTGSHCFASTSDGSTTRAYIDGEEVALAVVAGANNGDWFGDCPDGNVFSLSVQRRNVLTHVFNCRQSYLLIYDRPLAPLEFQKTQARGFTQRGPRWYPQR